jgi:hypothetical protein
VARQGLMFVVISILSAGLWGGQAQGGEDILLDQLAEMGLHCDPLTQLVVTCEVCRRPSTKECWTCGMKICDFCTLKRHWKACLSSCLPSPPFPSYFCDTVWTIKPLEYLPYTLSRTCGMKICHFCTGERPLEGTGACKGYDYVHHSCHKARFTL